MAEPPLPPSTSTSSGRAARIGLAAGPILAAVCWWLLPHAYTDAAGTQFLFTEAGRATFALMVWMATWWLTEAIDISATALLPIVILPITGAATIGKATAPYGDSLIFLFLGGFMLALAMQRWGLDRRIAMNVLRIVGTRPRFMIGGVMLVTATLSGFVSNTATTAMMLPIALSIIALVDSNTKNERGKRDQFALAMLLGIAYAASIGGIATKIGTPPNGLLLAFIEREYGREIGFIEWLAVGVPLVVVFLPLSWWMLTAVLLRVGRTPIPGADQFLKDQHEQLGTAKRAERVVLIVFGFTAFLWMVRPLLVHGIAGDEPGTYLLVPLVPGLSDAGIVIAAGLLLFLIPASRGGSTRVLEWSTMRGVPWGILILFGGGLSLAAAAKANGVAQFIGAQTMFLQGVPVWVIVLVITAGVIFLTELTSNTATTAALLPVLAGVATGLDVNPYMLLVPAALAASCAFMMPIATPPNAIVFGSGRITIAQMCRTGLWLNMAGIVIIMAVMYATVLPMLGAVG
jgi:solute carrier family 13 (sodium-dependent dicarboxylate transporter), member 2/3/5